jgi:hypothetical protein
MQDAAWGCESGFCDVNVNRDIPTLEGWWLGSNDTGPSDKTVAVLRFDTLQGQPIALLFTYGVQPSVMDGAQISAGGRLVSSDMTGVACRFLEKEYDDSITALFCLGAAADQAPALKARYSYVDRAGRYCVEDIHEQGFIIAELLGKRLGLVGLRIAETIKCQAKDVAIYNEQHRIKFPGQLLPDTQLIRPQTQYAFTQTEEREEPVEIVRMGEVALIGVRPELSCLTAVNLKQHSPFHHTLLLTMINGASKYMPESEAYERITYEAMNSPFAQGSAERLSEKVLAILRRLKKNPHIETTD